MTLFFCGAILFSLTGCRREVLDDNDDGDNVNVIQNHLTIDIAVLDLTGWLGVSASEQGSVQHMITAMGLPHIETTSVATACKYPMIVLVNALETGDLYEDEKTEGDG